MNLPHVTTYLQHAITYERLHSRVTVNPRLYLRAVGYLTAERAQLLHPVFELCPNLILLDPKIGQGLVKDIIVTVIAMDRLNSPHSEPSNNRITRPQNREADTGLHPVAQLSTIKLAGLQQDDGEEAEKLFRSAREDGFFYLNFQDSAFEGMINLVEDVFTISKSLFNLDNEEKMQYDVDKLGKLKLNG